MVHFTDADDGGHCPKFILFLDHEVKSLVLAIRGTFSPKDIILDAVAEEVPFLDGMAHKGILSGSKIILDKVLDSIISNLRMFPGNYTYSNLQKNFRRGYFVATFRENNTPNYIYHVLLCC